jgi:hypothetical protein
MKRAFFLALAGMIVMALPLYAAEKEHGGKEHAGEEHAGKPAKEFTADEIKAAITAYVEGRQKEGKGIFKMIDKDDGNKTLPLKFVKIHDPVRKIEEKGQYFACSDFQAADSPEEKLYDLDFWLKPEGDKLVVIEERVHKDPQKEGGKWVKKERYTFNEKSEIVWLRKPGSKQATGQ